MKALRFINRLPASAFLAVSLWAALWCNLNAGPWLVRDPAKPVGLLTFARVYAPAAVLLLAPLILHARAPLLPAKSPLALLGVYGIVGLIAGFGSQDPESATYWSVSFLATVAVCWATLTVPQATRVTTALLWATWIATLVVTAAIVVEGSHMVFGDSPTAYNIADELEGQVISSGVARWAAVVGLVLLIRGFHISSWPLRWGLLAGAVLAFFVVYRMQSRGAVLASAAALLFLLGLNRRFRLYTLPLLFAAACFVVLVDTDHTLPEKVMDYLRRGGTNEQLISMTGRTGYYATGWAAFLESPLLGYGQRADRVLDIGHIHNSFLQALLNAGIVGFLPYVLSWVAGWQLFRRLWLRRRQFPPALQVSLMECGTVMAFFTLRAVPETTTASFSPDLLMMLAIYSFLEGLVRLNAGFVRKRVVGRRNLREAGWAEPAARPSHV